MTTFIDELRARRGVEPICRILAIARSSYHAGEEPGAVGGGDEARDLGLG
jgi:hypothetical protein